MSRVLVIAAAFGLLLALVALWHAVGEPTTVQVAHRDAPPPSPARAVPASAAPAASPAKPPRLARSIARAVAALNRPSNGSSGPSLSPAEPAPPTEHLEYGSKQLHAQTAAVEPQIRACLARAAAAGSRPTGTAVVTYIVAHKAKKLVIDSTDVDGDNTTLTDQPLVECLRDTAKAMKFAGLPHDADAIVATRRIVIDHGALVENKHVTFSYLQ